jgi:UDP:flavonoid glycosyltransferase YjiC (YdhE family)
MRILFTCVVGFGHFNPMVPLARAFVTAGHPVAFATDPGFCATVEAAGFPAFPAGLDHAEALARFRALMPSWAGLPGEARAAYLYPGMFGRVRVPAMLPDLQAIVERWSPGMLIHDSAEMAGAIAAEAAGIPHVEHSFGLLRPVGMRRDATDAIDPSSAAAGVRNPGVGGFRGEPYLDICPPGLQFREIDDVAHVIPLRPVSIEAPVEPRFAAWIAGRGARPIVYLTMGTVFNDADLVGTILDAMSGEPIDIIVTVGPEGDPAILGAQPDHVHVAGFIPQAQALRHSRVMVSHAGSGAMLGALGAGVPILAIPQGADQFMNAERIVGAGLGVRILRDELEPATIRERLAMVLEEPRFGSMARSFRREIETMPSPAAVVEQLVAADD